MSSLALSSAPIQYTPIKDGQDLYIDDITRFGILDFTGVGIKCPCSKSKKVHRNKYSFKHQHCNTMRHKLFVKNYKETIEDNQNVENITNKDIRTYKIQIRKTEEALQLEKQKTKSLGSKITDTEIKLKELYAEFKQLDTCSSKLSKENIKIKEENEKHKNTIKLLTEQNKKYEKFAKMMINIAGYEIQDS